MSKTLPVLIKLAERKVETLQQALNKTHTAMDAVKADMAACERAMADAFLDAVGDNDVLMLQAASAFQERMRLQLEELKTMLANLTEMEKVQRAQLQDAFAEQKRYEILDERQKAEAKKVRAKKAQNNLDEVAQKKGY